MNSLIEAYKAAKAEYESHQQTGHIEYKKICKWLERKENDNNGSRSRCERGNSNTVR